MRRFFLILVMSVAEGVVSGCSNAVYFYETEKISFTAEGRPDAAQPVSANLGIKQRVVVVVPPGDKTARKVKGETREPKYEAVSMVSYFSFDKKPGTGKGWFSDAITIDTALITGDAARELTQDQAKEAFKAFAQVGSVGQRTAALTTFGVIVDFLRQSETAKDRQVEEILGRLEESSRGILVDCKEFPQFTWTAGAAGRPGQMRVEMVQVRSAAAKVQEVDRLLEYRGKLGESVDSLKRWSESPSQNGCTFPSTMPVGVRTDTVWLMATLAEQTKRLEALDRRIGQDGAVLDATRYFSEQMFRKAGK